VTKNWRKNAFYDIQRYRQFMSARLERPVHRCMTNFQTFPHRVTLQQGDVTSVLKSIKLFGHGPTTTIGREKSTNPFLRWAPQR
jgi:hypothetical protein